MPPKSKNNSDGYSDISFAAIRLETEQVDQFVAWGKSLGDNWSAEFATLVVEGWKLSLTWDGKNDCFIASLTNRNEGAKNYNICVTSRSDDPVEALLLSAYKIAVLFHNQTLPTEQIKNNWG